MKPTVAVMAREVMARRELLLLAVAAAIIAALMPLMPGLGHYQPDDVRTVSSNTLALALGWGLALLIGATMIGGDLSEGRLGFYFARPVSGLALWWGRVLAAFFLILVCEIIVLLPSLFGGLSVLVSSDVWGWPALIGYLVLPLLLLLLAHAISIMVRARTAWLLLDLAGFVVFAVVAWVSLRPLLMMVAEIAVWVIAGALTVALLVALSVAGWMGVAVGRVDLPRTHGALSLALWGTLAVCLAGIVAYSSWLRNFGPPEFDDVEVLTVAPDGRWVETFGHARNRFDVRRRCLISTTDDLWIPVTGSWARYPMDVVYSVDGSTALWRGAGSSDRLRALWWADLGRRDPSARQTNLVVATDALLALSAAGNRLAILEEETLSIYELEDEHLLTAVRLPEGFDRVTPLFHSEEALRLFVRVGHGDGQSLLIVNVVVSTGEIIPTGKIKGLGDKSLFMVDGGLKHIVVWTRSEEGLASERRICDATNGTVIRKLTTSGLPRFLHDGRLVILTVGDDRSTSLVVQSADGGERIVHSISAAGEPRLSGEAVANGVVISRLENPEERSEGLRIDLVDVDTGEVRNIGRHLRRGVSWLPWQRGSAGAVCWFRDRPATSRLFLDQAGALMRWNPETGGLAHVVGGGG
jgi:hypothetical protein